MDLGALGLSNLYVAQSVARISGPWAGLFGETTVTTPLALKRSRVRLGSPSVLCCQVPRILKSQTGGASWAEAGGYTKHKRVIKTTKRTVCFMGPPLENCLSLRPGVKCGLPNGQPAFSPS